MTRFHIQEASSSPQRNGLVHKSPQKNAKSHSKTANGNKTSYLANGHTGHGPKLKKNGFSYQCPVTGKIWKKVLYEQV